MSRPSSRTATVANGDDSDTGFSGHGLIHSSGVDARRGKPVIGRVRGGVLG
jgi:hypothetical protein